MESVSAVSPSECVFCRIVNGQLPAVDLILTKYIASFTPLDPVTPGHRLFIPRTHTTGLRADPILLAHAMFAAAEWASKAEHPEDCNLISSDGVAATQTIRHLHVHYVPRREGDCLPLPWTFQQSKK